ncbi:MAG: hypothetical protein ABI831_04520 [Betaproteobacteria bacterium]
MYEHRSRPLLSRRDFYKRLGKSAAAGSALIIGSLAMGMLGYHFLEDLQWIDAFVNAAMILSGMGPLANPATFAGKLFAGCYALYSGLVLLIAVGVFIAPVFHRFLHRFHLEQEARDQDSDGDDSDSASAAGQRKSAPRAGRARGRKTGRVQGP